MNFFSPKHIYPQMNIDCQNYSHFLIILWMRLQDIELF